MARTAGTLRTRTIAGRTFRCSNRTAWHLRWTLFVLKLRYPKAQFYIYQTCYNTTVAASRGTHDYDAVFDVKIIGLDWWRAQRFLRRRGWAAWYRHTGVFENIPHIHMVSIPPGLSANPSALEVQRAFAALGIRVGVYVPGQIDDYYAHAYGLAGQHRAGADRSFFPDNINRTVFRRRWWFNRVNR
jgi:hypothetical protein